MSKLPKVVSTQQERIDALKEARGLLFESKGLMASKTGNTLELIRLAEYITTGHDYLDTHPTDDDQEEEDN